RHASRGAGGVAGAARSDDAGWRALERAVPRRRRTGCDRRAALARRTGTRRAALHRPDADAHPDSLDGRLLSDLRRRSADVRRQLAADRLDPPPGVSLLDGARHLPRTELRALLRRTDAVQRDKPPDQHLAARRRLLHLRRPPGLVRPQDAAASL